MALIDTHTHAWGADTDELPWTRPLLPPGWEGPYTHRDLVADMDRVGVDEAVVVSLPVYGRERGNEYTMRAIEAHPDRLYGVAIADFFGEAPAVRERIRRVAGHPRVLGVRLHAALEYGDVPGDVDREGDWIRDERLEPVWETLAATDATAFVLPKAQQLGMVEEVVAEHPDLDVVVDHMAWIDETTDPDEPPWTAFRSLAEHDRVSVKVSSVPRSSTEGWPYPDVQAYLRKLLEWFGADRLMLGSDYPWMDDWAAYADCLNWLEAVEFLSRRDRAYLRYRTFDELA